MQAVGAMVLGSSHGCSRARRCGVSVAFPISLLMRSDLFPFTPIVGPSSSADLWLFARAVGLSWGISPLQ